MTYPYGTKGAPPVGKGLGGLPRREQAAASTQTAPAFPPQYTFIATTTGLLSSRTYGGIVGTRNWNSVCNKYAWSDDGNSFTANQFALLDQGEVLEISPSRYGDNGHADVHGQDICAIASGISGLNKALFVGTEEFLFIRTSGSDITGEMRSVFKDPEDPENKFWVYGEFNGSGFGPVIDYNHETEQVQTITLDSNLVDVVAVIPATNTYSILHTLSIYNARMTVFDRATHQSLRQFNFNWGTWPQLLTNTVCYNKETNLLFFILKTNTANPYSYRCVFYNIETEECLYASPDALFSNTSVEMIGLKDYAFWFAEETGDTFNRRLYGVDFINKRLVRWYDQAQSTSWFFEKQHIPGGKHMFGGNRAWIYAEDLMNGVSYTDSSLSLYSAAQTRSTPSIMNASGSYSSSSDTTYTNSATGFSSDTYFTKFPFATREQLT